MITVLVLSYQHSIHFAFTIKFDLIVIILLADNSLFYYALTKDLPTALKTLIKQQLTIERKNEEMSQIMSTLP